MWHVCGWLMWHCWMNRAWNRRRWSKFLFFLLLFFLFVVTVMYGVNGQTCKSYFIINVVSLSHVCISYSSFVKKSISDACTYHKV